MTLLIVKQEVLGMCFGVVEFVGILVRDSEKLSNFV